MGWFRTTLRSSGILENIALGNPNGARQGNEIRVDSFRFHKLLSGPPVDSIISTTYITIS